MGNGQMLYPHIKKSKEVNLNLPCLSYKIDIDAAMSRVGECMRMGCNMSFCFFFQKLHIYCVREAYSLLPKMRNDFNYDDIYEIPVELFGVPEELPMFSLLCKGSINNYRLYNYGTKKSKDYIEKLYTLTMDKSQTDVDSYFLDYKEYGNTLYHPRYMYDRKNKALAKIREKLGIDFKEVKQFWDENPSYRFLKPRHRKKLIPWLKCMFFNRGFTEAYTKLSRTQMTLRLSQYSSSKILCLLIGNNFKYDDLEL